MSVSVNISCWNERFIKYVKGCFRTSTWFSKILTGMLHGHGPLLKTLLAICQKSRVKILENNRLFYFISICKFGSFKNPFATITSLSELSFRLRRFILLVQSKKVIFMRLDLILRWGTSIPTWTHSQNLLAAVEAPSLRISFHWTSQRLQRPSRSARE